MTGPQPADPRNEAQLGSAGDSAAEIHDAALALAEPRPGLSWLDVGCGTGTVLRAIRDRHAPAALLGVDAIEWLDEDLRGDVEMIVAPAEQVGLEPADRVLMVETIEHLEAPWSVLRAAAGAVRPGGLIVVTTPSVTSLRHRAELLLRGRLTSFRPDNLPHLGPALPHVTARVMSEAGLTTSVSWCCRDVVPKSGGRRWPAPLHRAAPQLTSLSVAVVGRRGVRWD
jgi:SAM-dependent methyltransferase